MNSGQSFFLGLGSQSLTFDITRPPQLLVSTSAACLYDALFCSPAVEAFQRLPGAKRNVPPSFFPVLFFK